MLIEEFKGGEGLVAGGEEKELTAAEVLGGGIGVLDAKRVLVGAGARALFYPTLLYNVVRNKTQAEFRWWDQIDEFILLGAVPFPADVKRLKELGVGGVITLNEPYETLVPTSLYQDYGIDHLVLPTRDYLFAPSTSDICRAVDFIHENTLCKQITYVHCKAGRGRSTTIVICYLVQHKQMTPNAAYDYVKSIRPRVLLASSQWKAVQEYYSLKVKKMCNSSYMSVYGLTCPTPKVSKFYAAANLFALDDGSVVLITKADLDGYDPSHESDIVRGEFWADLSLVYRVRVAGQAALARVSCLWLRCDTHQNISSEKLLHKESSCLTTADEVRGVGVDIQVH